MSVLNPLRALFLCVGVAAILLTAGIGSASNGPEAVSPQMTVPAPKTSKGKGYWDAKAGRLCPDEVGYGKYDQPITVQDT